MLSFLHFGQNKGNSRSIVRCSSRSRVFAPQAGHKTHFSPDALMDFHRFVRCCHEPCEKRAEHAR